MKVKFIVFVLAVVVVSSFAARGFNFNGIGDTTLVRDSVGTNDLKYSDAFKLSNSENIRVVVYGRDTTEAGFGSDSLEFDWGYQTGMLGVDTLGGRAAIDTIWDIRVKLAAFASANLGSQSEALLDSTNTLVRSVAEIDTLNTLGWATMSRNFSPEWDVFIRYWMQGNAANSTEKILVKFQHNARVSIPVLRP